MTDQMDSTRIYIEWKVFTCWRCLELWCFGVTLWEMYTFGDIPYGNIGENDLITLLDCGGRLKVPVLCPKNVFQIMLECWNLEPKNRPIFRHLAEYFVQNIIVEFWNDKNWTKYSEITILLFISFYSDRLQKYIDYESFSQNLRSVCACFEVKNIFYSPILNQSSELIVQILLYSFYQTNIERVLGNIQTISKSVSILVWCECKLIMYHLRLEFTVMNDVSSGCL